MEKDNHPHETGCACGCSRRRFLVAAGTALGGLALGLPGVEGETAAPRPPREGATIRVAFLYPPSKTFSGDPEGWWSWPGSEFDAEGRQKAYLAALRAMEKKLGIRVVAESEPLANAAAAQKLAEQLKTEKPDGLLLVMFYHNSRAAADVLLKAADELGIPAIFYVGLGSTHGPIKGYRRPGVYFIQSLENLDAIESGLRMIQARKIMRQSRLLLITEAPQPREGVEAFFGTTVRVVPFPRYAEEFRKITLRAEARRWMEDATGHARQVRGVTRQALENAARAHFALKKMLADEQADGVSMTCLRRGMLKPCMAFSSLNGALVPAACEGDLAALYTQLLGQLLTGRPGFQHNPCFETERNHYYASHCTCATRLHGPGAPRTPYLLRRFDHTNEGSCAIQVFWKEGEPVTMVRYYGGKEPALDVYAGKVFRSHAMPPAGGCTTNVEIEITDRDDATQVSGHHNLLFCGDYARQFRLFAQLHKMKLAETGYQGAWPL